MALQRETEGGQSDWLDTDQTLTRHRLDRGERPITGRDERENGGGEGGGSDWEGVVGVILHSRSEILGEGEGGKGLISPPPGGRDGRSRGVHKE